MMKKFMIIVLVTTALLLLNKNLYATTNFNIKRKSLKIYENYDVNNDLITDSNNLKYKSSNEDIATISNDGIIFTKKQGKFDIIVSDENSSVTCEFSSGYYVGIDVSRWNGIVDWKKVKDQGIDFAMIKSSTGWYDENDEAAGEEYDFQYDKQFLNNIKGASENNLSFGIYHYSLAKNIEEARLEAEYVLNAINEYGKTYKNNMTLPIAYDIEDSSIQKLSKAKITENAIAFCVKIYEAGYTPIIYSNNNFFRNYIDLDKLNAMAYNYWFAAPKTNPNFSDKITIADTKISPIMWQYSFDGDVEGANTDQGKVDMNVLYMKDRVKIIIQNEGQVVDTIGVDKGEKIEELPTYEKQGYTFEGFKDENNNTITKDYKYNKDMTITTIFSKIKITEIILNKSNIEISSKKDYNIQVDKVIPQTATLDGEKVLYKSDNTKVATVDNSGKITPIADGKCNIIVYLELDKNVQAICTVNVHFGYIKGDLDKNGIVNANDAAIALDLYKYGNVKEEELKIGDMDNNGIINANDAALILDIYKYGE